MRFHDNSSQSKHSKAAKAAVGAAGAATVGGILALIIKRAHENVNGTMEGDLELPDPFTEDPPTE